MRTYNQQRIDNAQTRGDPSSLCLSWLACALREYSTERAGTERTAHQAAMRPVMRDVRHATMRYNNTDEIQHAASLTHGAWPAYSTLHT